MGNGDVDGLGFLPMGDRNEVLLFLGPGWNVFLCWTTKNSQQRFYIIAFDEKDRMDFFLNFIGLMGALV